MLAEKLGTTEAELQRSVPITVMTRGEAGSVITVGDEEFEIPAAKPTKVADPTGAGDAFRSGFVLGYKRKLPWPVVGRLASSCRPSMPSSSTALSNTPIRFQSSRRAIARTSARQRKSTIWFTATRRHPDPGSFLLPACRKRAGARSYCGNRIERRERSITGPDCTGGG